MLLSLTVAGGHLSGPAVLREASRSAKDLGNQLRPLYTLSFNKWYLDWLLDVKGVEAGKAVNNALWSVDSTVVDGGVNGAGWMTRFWAKITGWWDKWVIDLAVNATGFVTKVGSYVVAHGSNRILAELRAAVCGGSVCHFALLRVPGDIYND